MVTVVTTVIFVYISLNNQMKKRDFKYAGTMSTLQDIVLFIVSVCLHALRLPSCLLSTLTITYYSVWLHDVKAGNLRMLKIYIVQRAADIIVWVFHVI